MKKTQKHPKRMVIKVRKLAKIETTGRAWGPTPNGG
jgi:hypothetical protein